MGVSINGGTPKFGWFIMEDINYNGGHIYIYYIYKKMKDGGVKAKTTWGYNINGASKYKCTFVLYYIYICIYISGWWFGT